MAKIAHIALNTFRESVRSKVLYVLIFFAVLLMVASHGLGWVTVGEQVQIVKHFSLAAVSFFGALIAVFVGTGLIYKEIEKRTIYTILSKPVHRWQFVLGKFGGLMAVLAFVVAGMGMIGCLFVLYAGGTVDALYLQALALLYLELMVVVAIAVFFSTVSTPILAAIFTFCAYLVGQVTPSLMELVTFEGPTLDYHLQARAVTDWPQLCKTLTSGIEKPPPNPHHRIWNALPEQVRRHVQAGAEGTRLSAEERAGILAAFNRILDDPAFYRAEDFADADLPPAADSLLERDAADLSESEQVRRNRFLVEAAFPDVIAREAKRETVAHLTQEHLTDFVTQTHWIWKPFGLVMYYVLPDLTHFHLRNRVVYGPPLQSGAFFYEGEAFQATLYALCYAGAVLVVAILCFDRKRF